jgi:hypothetical protein
MLLAVELRHYPLENSQSRSLKGRKPETGLRFLSRTNYKNKLRYRKISFILFDKGAIEDYNYFTIRREVIRHER